MQTAEQILAVTNESLKRSEQDFGSAKTELSATNRQLKDAQRQLEALQIQLSKSMSILLLFFIADRYSCIQYSCSGIAEGRCTQGRPSKRRYIRRVAERAI